MADVSPLEELVAGVLAEHWLAQMSTSSLTRAWKCTCGETIKRTETAHQAHVAAEVAKALGAEQYDEKRIGIRNTDGELEPIEVGAGYDTRLTPLLCLRREITHVPSMVGEWQEVLDA